MVKRALILIAVLLLSLLTVSAAEENCLYYFYGVGCEECKTTNEFVENLENTNVELFEVYQNRESAHLLENFFDGYSVPESSRGLPVVFVHDSYFIGAQAIHDLTGQYFKDNNGECPTAIVEQNIGIAGDKDPHDVLDTLGFIQITKSAVKDSVRPTMVALLVLFIALLLAVKLEPEKGVIFIITAALTYFLHFFGWFGWFSSISAGVFFSRLVGVGMILGSLITFKGFFGTWKHFTAKIPEKHREIVKKYYPYIYSPGGLIIIGFIATLFTFANTETIFVTLQSLLTEDAVRFEALPLVLYYVILLMVPMIVVYAIYKVLLKQMVERAEDKEPHNDKKQNLWKKHQHKCLLFL